MPVHNRLRVRHLRLLEALERSENLGQAAEELRITQSAATKILQDAEELRGLPLFERRHRGMAPTEIGRFVIGYARRILNDIEGFLDELSALKRGGYGFLSVGAIMATTPGILPAAIAELKRRRPLLTISLVATTSDRLLAALGLRELELAICRLTHLRQRSQFDIEFLANEELWVFVSKDHALAARAAVSLDEVSRFPWVLQPWTSPARQAIESAFAAERVSSPEARVETTSIFAALHLVREAGMVGVLPSTILSESVARADLVRLPINLPNTLLEYGIVTRREEPLSANALEFISVIREQYAAVRA
ncbi:MAG: LysR family transcriptional regulator [Microvirga sp.]